MRWMPSSISMLEAMSVEYFKTEKLGEQTEKERTEYPRLWDNYKRCNTCLPSGNNRRKRERKEQEKYLKKWYELHMVGTFLEIRKLFRGETALATGFSVAPGSSVLFYHWLLQPLIISSPNLMISAALVAFVVSSLHKILLLQKLYVFHVLCIHTLKEKGLD